MRSIPVAAALLALVTIVPCASAQQPTAAAKPSQIRVTKDRATIWTRNPSLVLAVAPAGTVLDVVARDGQWYEVYVPERLSGRTGTVVHGFIFTGHAELMPGSPPPPARAPARGKTIWDEEAGRRAGGRAPLKRQTLAVRGSGSVSAMIFQAQDSFKAVFGENTQPLYGGGAEVVLWDHVFAAVSAERFHKTGERVIVSDGQVFKLGISDTVTITPVTFTGGYRFRATREFVPYVGGGAGFYKFKEESEFAEPSENSSETFTSYHALAGVEYGVRPWLFASFEAQYTSAPDALGAPGVGEDFDESNLGGISLRLKVSIGR
jgi:opacity protein-like surface antigen